MSHADALTREAAWLRDDQAAAGLPPLLAGVGDGSGPFGLIEAYPRRVVQQGHQLFVCRDPYVEAAMDRAGQWREGQHGIVLLVLWRRVAAAGAADQDQAALDAAMERILDRVRGLPTDHTHGGRFFSVAEAPGELRVEYPDVRVLDAPVDAPFGAGNAYSVLVRYTATDAFPG